MRPYLYLAGAYILLSPVIVAFFNLDHPIDTSILITFIGFIIYMFFGTLFFNWMENGHALRFYKSEWELVEENKPMIEQTTNAILGHLSTRNVLVDIYRRKKRDGSYKYKTIKRF